MKAINGNSNRNDGVFITKRNASINIFMKKKNNTQRMQTIECHKVQNKKYYIYGLCFVLVWFGGNVKQQHRQRQSRCVFLS